MLPPPSSVGLLPAGASLASRIDNEHPTVVAGDAFSVTVVVTNRGGTAVNLNQANHGYRPTIDVALANRSVTPQLGSHVDVCYLTPLLLPPGTSRFPVRVLTTGGGCVAPGGTAAAGSAVQRCSPGGPALLPPGRHALVLGGYNLALPEAPVAYVALVGHQ